jgi:nucleoside-diphosphate-sugar epimerase
MRTGHIIVTGESGFLGRYAAVRLCNAGYDVLGVSRHAASTKTTGGSYMQAQLNLEDPSCIDELTRRAGGRVRAIVHFAAALPVSFGTSNSEECSRRNFLIDDHIIRVCERLACSLVYGSSASVYSMHSPDLNAEDSPTETCEPYAAEKLAMEREALSRAPLFTGLRITAPYGPCQRTRTVVRIFLEQALQNRSLLIHGEGNREQDFIHAADVAEAVLCSIESSVSGVFNIGCGAPVTMKKLAEITTRSVLGCTSEVRRSGLDDPQEPRYARISITKARSQLGWSPKVTLDQGIYQWAELLRNEARHANCAPI